MKQIPPAIIFTLCLFLAACGGTGSPAIAPVTPLPAVLSSATPASAVAESTPQATPTPLSIALPQGKAAAIAAATDIAFKPTPRSRIVFDSYPVPIVFDEFYEGYDMRKGLTLSDKLVSLDGQAVTIDG